MCFVWCCSNIGMFMWCSPNIDGFWVMHLIGMFWVMQLKQQYVLGNAAQILMFCVMLLKYWHVLGDAFQMGFGWFISLVCYGWCSANIDVVWVMQLKYWYTHVHVQKYSKKSHKKISGCQFWYAKAFIFYTCLILLYFHGEMKPCVQLICLPKALKKCSFKFLPYIMLIYM